MHPEGVGIGPFDPLIQVISFHVVSIWNMRDIDLQTRNNQRIHRFSRKPHSGYVVLQNFLQICSAPGLSFEFGGNLEVVNRSEVRRKPPIGHVAHAAPASAIASPHSVWFGCHRTNG